MDAFMKANRRNWNERIPIHLRDRTGFYDVDGVRAGSIELPAFEAAELGDLSGKRLLHLQCHFGLDSLVLARRGADVTGLDYSAPAIAAARDLAAETALDARFVEGNVYDARALVEGPFAIVYSTWGTIIWLPDLVRWAKIVAGLLAPGGFLYLADCHPGILPLEEEEGRLVFRYAWQSAPDAPDAFDTPTTYTGDPQILENQRTYEWSHPFSRIIGALIGAGLSLDFLHEHEVLPWKAFPMMVSAATGLFRLPDGHSPLPLAFSLKASKPV